MIDMRKWIVELAAATGYRILKEQIDVYERKLQTWNLSDSEWQWIMSKATDSMDRFPTLPQLGGFAKDAISTRQSKERAWRLLDGPNGYRYAEQMPGPAYEEGHGPAMTYQQWRATPEGKATYAAMTQKGRDILDRAAMPRMESDPTKADLERKRNLMRRELALQDAAKAQASAPHIEEEAEISVDDYVE